MFSVNMIVDNKKNSCSQ